MIHILMMIFVLALLRIFLYKRIGKKNFVILSGFLMFILSALRSIHFAPDTLGYVTQYLSLTSTSTSTLLFGKDPLFYILSKLMAVIGINYHIWLALIALLFISAISYIIYKYSDDPFMSFLIIISIGFFFFSLTGLRQIVALSFIIFSYNYLNERKFIPFLSLVILASLFHITAIVFLIAYPISKLKVGCKQIVIILFLAIFALSFGSMLVFLGHNLQFDLGRFSGYFYGGPTLNWMGFFIQLAIYIFCMFHKDRVISKDGDAIILYNLLFLGIIFQIFSTVIAEFFRISLYFSIFSIILIPRAIISIKHKTIRLQIYLAITLILIIYFICSQQQFMDFAFFWQV